ncbi:MAG: hypothetical protein KAU46_08040 [Candidatus Aminicenantes bacterium]|nr:hypothetical protein [Candidatus Aminicenantes bacterium]
MRLTEIRRTTGFCFVVYLFFLGSTSIALAGNNDGASSGLYFGLTYGYNSIGGDFDGQKYFDFEEETILVPKVKSGSGVGIVLGSKFKLKRNKCIALELAHYNSTHDNARVWAEAGSVFFNMFILNVKYNFLANKITQPFFNGELALSKLRVEGGSLFGTNEVAIYGDASYGGLSVGFGGGIEYCPHPKVSVNLGVIFRFLIVYSVKGEFIETSNIETLMSISPNITIGLNYTFLSRKRLRK